MDSLTIKRIECSNSLFEQYLKRALYWDEAKVFAPSGLTKKDFDDTTKAYGLYGDELFVGFSLVKFDSKGNVVSMKRVVDSLNDQNRRLSDYFDENMLTIAEAEADSQLIKMKRF